MAQTRFTYVEAVDKKYSKRLYEVINGLLQNDKSKRWSADSVIDYIENDRDKKVYFSEFEEIEAIKRQLEKKVNQSVLNSVLNENDLQELELTPKTTMMIYYLKDLESNVYSYDTDMTNDSSLTN